MNLQAENAQRQSEDLIRNKWMPRFHACIAYVASMFYLGLRREAIDFPQQLHSIINNKTFQITFIGIGLFGATITAMAIFRHMNYELCDKTSIFGAFSFDSENYKLRYYKPYLLTVLFVIVLEIIILVLNS